MDFPKEELLTRCGRIREEYIKTYKPDFEVIGGTTRFVRFNDAWRGLNPYSKFLIPRLTNRKNTFPKRPAARLSKNADPANYVSLRYDSSGALRVARLGRYNNSEFAIVYVSKQLTISYTLYYDSGDDLSYSLYGFEWYEFDDSDRLIGAEEFQVSDGGEHDDAVKINCEYYEYDDDNLTQAWCFNGYENNPVQMTFSLVQQFMPDRIFNPDIYEYTFKCGTEGLDYTSNHYYRKSQTITDEGHVSDETLLHLADNGFLLKK